jgi:hypothetical protein
MSAPPPLCPECRNPLQPAGEGKFACVTCARTYRARPSARQATAAQAVRQRPDADTLAGLADGEPVTVPPLPRPATGDGTPPLWRRPVFWAPAAGVVCLTVAVLVWALKGKGSGGPPPSDDGPPPAAEKVPVEQPQGRPRPGPSAVQVASREGFFAAFKGVQDAHREMQHALAETKKDAVGTRELLQKHAEYTGSLRALLSACERLEEQADRYERYWGPMREADAGREMARDVGKLTRLALDSAATAEQFYKERWIDAERKKAGLDP